MCSLVPLFSFFPLSYKSSSALTLLLASNPTGSPFLSQPSLSATALPRVFPPPCIGQVLGNVPSKGVRVDLCCTISDEHRFDDGCPVPI